MMIMEVPKVASRNSQTTLQNEQEEEKIFIR